ncbi:ribonuclease III [Helicobacter sp. MIT 05-5293]|uniref:ribonuclease III n=1 Tax=Helicobacter sp. MIT 05-5293 TaxID=1548149 RepID=UPI000A860ACD|nr:ribonuclease III [Helicobacter sp. MIT 05-5293]TLD81007.1 ribonuclease III [Helicobacter sp. MIT 05-5293]
MSNTSITALESALQYKFQNHQLLIEALTHRSCKKSYNNERLEFLGDAVLDLLVGEYLFKKFPLAQEGELSKLRACIVNEKGFMKIAQSIDLGDHILISQSEENNKGRHKASILSNAFEALIGAIYLESHLQCVQKIVNRLLEMNYARIDLDSLFMDYKTALQEITQARFGQIPVYTLIAESGPDHKKSFEISLSIDGKIYAQAKGNSKKDAQQKCAKIALEQLERNL